MDNIIEIKSLTKSYGKKRGVIDVNLEVKEGEIYGFLGPNGAGKSTTIRSMLGFLKFNEGSIKILGMDSVKNRNKILKEIGYMPSEAQFYQDMRVSEVIKFASDMRGVDCKEEAKRLCERLSVDTSKKIRELSLGNRKKVSIVCAMQHKPKLFIFDEPTSGLDPLVQSEFFELIHEYVKEGSTCLLSTHVLSEVKNHCEEVTIMKEGKVLVTDTVDNLTRNNAKRIRVTADGKIQEYLYDGDINELLLKLQASRIEDLTIEEASIEDIFMHYYSKEN